jgi:hypothetical protein
MGQAVYGSEWMRPVAASALSLATGVHSNQKAPLAGSSCKLSGQVTQACLLRCKTRSSWRPQALLAWCGAAWTAAAAAAGRLAAAHRHAAATPRQGVVRMRRVKVPASAARTLAMAQHPARALARQAARRGATSEPLMLGLRRPALESPLAVWAPCLTLQRVARERHHAAGCLAQAR